MYNGDIILEFIQYNRDTLDLIMDLVPIPLFVKDRAGLYIACNITFAEFMSINRKEIIGKSVYELWEKDEADVFFAQDEALFQQGGLQVYEANVTSSKGTHHVVQFHKQTFTDSSGAVAGFLGAVFDITEKKKLEYALARQAAVDELTGLPNRREGMAELEILHRDSEKKNRPYCIATIDIDRFKLINDLYGHNNGDIALKAFSDLAKKILRRSDICFRYGGDEFIVLLPETELEDGFTVVEGLRRALDCDQLLLPDGRSVQATVSIGLTQYAADSISPEQLLRASDQALYDAKNAGRNRTVCIRQNRKTENIL